MENTTTLRYTRTRPWMEPIASLLPLWLLSFAIMAEGFPRPPVSVELGIAFVILATLISLLLVWKRPTNVVLVIYSLIPYTFLFLFDEITTTYKSPFIFLSALILTAGALAFHSSRSWPVRILVLLLAAVMTLFLAANAAENFWGMAADLGYVECFPDYSGCAPLSADAAPWWRLFFSP
jgi:hypothetical protein